MNSRLFIDRIAFGSRSQARIAGYRIGRDQSAGVQSAEHELRAGHRRYNWARCTQPTEIGCDVNLTTGALGSRNLSRLHFFMPRGLCRTQQAADGRPARDIEGALDTLCVECTKCSRKGRYSVRKLIEKYGRKANMMKWKEQLNGDCPKRDAHSMHERCDLVCPDLPKVL